MTRPGDLRSWIAIGLSLGAASSAFAREPPPPASLADAPADETPPVFTDSSITADVTARLEKVKLLQTSLIAISTYNGVVRMAGTVPSDLARQQALRVARGTPGVVRVDDHLRVDISSPEAPSRN
jgi:hypothetical protein